MQKGTGLVVLALSAVCLTLACSDDDGSVGTTGGNTPPDAVFTVTPDSADTDTYFEFNAAASSDAEDDAADLEICWDWDNDGTRDTPWSTFKTTAHRYDTPGPKTIELKVRDTQGLMDSTTRTVTVIDHGPRSGPMVIIFGGTFVMGDSVAFCGVSERQVTLTHHFAIGVYEVTNEWYCDAIQWAFDQGYVAAGPGAFADALDGSTVDLLRLDDPDCGINFDGQVFTVDAGKKDHPVVGVTWYGAAAYCDWLSMARGRPRAYDHSTWQCNGGDPYRAVGYRLPTDAEWEYATQCYGERAYPWGDETPDCARANFGAEGCVNSTAAVGSYPPGPADPPFVVLFDMAGNVWEWCNDWAECDLGTEPGTDPTGPATGTDRVMRGGAWDSLDPNSLRCASRSYGPPLTRHRGIGFRYVRTW